MFLGIPFLPINSTGVSYYDNVNISSACKRGRLKIRPGSQTSIGTVSCSYDIARYSPSVVSRVGSSPISLVDVKSLGCMCTWYYYYGYYDIDVGSSGTLGPQGLPGLEGVTYS